MDDKQTLEKKKYSPEQPHPLGKELEKWWAQHGFDSTSEQWQEFLTIFYEKYLPEKVQELSIKHDNMGKLGASGAGGCLKKQVLKKVLAEKDINMRYEGSDYWTFLHGHILEAVVLSTLELLDNVEIVSTQHVVEDERTYTTADAVIIYNGKRALLSVKTTSYKGSFYSKGKPNLRGFAALVNEGIYWENKHAYCQSQMEMGITGIPDTIVIVAAKDYIKAMANVEALIRNSSMAFYSEHIPFRKDHFEEIKRHRGWVIEQAKAITEDEYDYNKGGAMEWSPELERRVKIHQWTKSTFKKKSHASLPYNPCGYCELAPACWTLVHARTITIESKEQFRRHWKVLKDQYKTGRQ